MTDLPGDPSLPPGVSQYDIDLAAGGYELCRNCGLPIYLNGAHVDVQVCDECVREDE